MDRMTAGVEIEVAVAEGAAEGMLPLGEHPPGERPMSERPGGGHAGWEGHRGVAVLLGIAAVLAAIVGVRATGLASDASDAWQSAVRTEVKHSAGAVADIRYLYQSEVPPVVTIIATRLREAELRAEADKESGPAVAALTREADVAAGMLAAISPAYELGTHPAYALPGGGVNLGLRLADLRNQNPDLVALDPDGIQAAGDAIGAKAGATTLPLLPIGIGALFGALAGPFAGRRRPLLVLGAASLAFGALAAVAVEALA